MLKRYQFASHVIDRFPEPTLEQLLEPGRIDHKLLDQDRLLTVLERSDEAEDSSPLGLGIDPPIESCPACLGPISFESLRFAICQLGHVWDRCSVTFQILSTTKLRVCTGCSRKSMRLLVGKPNDPLYEPQTCPNTTVTIHATEADTDPPSTQFHEPGNGIGELDGHPEGTRKSANDLESPALSFAFLRILLECSCVCLHCGGRWKVSC